MEITRDTLKYFSENNAPIYSFERSAKAPGKDIEYEEIQSPDSDEPVYMWAENKMGQCRIMYYSEAYNIELNLSTTNGDMPFRELESLVIAELPEGVTEIPDYTFRKCSKLSKVVFPNSLKQIGESAFFDCTALNTVEFADGIEMIGDNAFHGAGIQGKLELPSGLKKIEEWAFADCKGTTSVVLNEGLEKIGSAAFRGTSITELELPSTVKSVWNGAFVDCTNLSSVSLNEGLIMIGANAFSNEIALGQLPDSLEMISGRLNEDVKVNSNLVMDEYGVIFNKDKTALLATTKDIEGEYRIPEGVLSIGSGAFKGQTLTGIIWNQELEEIGSAAFYDCERLVSVPPVLSGVKELNSTFYNCTSLTEVTVPGTVETLKNTFMGCKNLVSVTLEEGIKKVGANSTFAGCDKLGEISYPASAR